MSRIYANADRVYIYTGENVHASNRSGEAALQCFVNGDINFEDLLEQQRVAAGGQMYLLRHSYIDVVNAFFERPYFQRKWVIQEIALASEATIACGKVEIPWGMTTLQAWRIQERFPQINIPRWLQNLERFGRRNPKELVDLVFKTRYNRCTDERDRIFSLLGLLDEKERERLQPDYTRTARDILIGFAAWIIEQCGLTYLLQFRQTKVVGDTRLGPSARYWLPTWAPLWDENTRQQASADEMRSWFVRLFFDLPVPYRVLDAHKLWRPSDRHAATESSRHANAKTIVHAEMGTLVITSARLIKVGADAVLFRSCRCHLEETLTSITGWINDRLRLFLTNDAGWRGSSSRSADFQPNDVFATIADSPLLLHLRPTARNTYYLLQSGLLALSAVAGVPSVSNTLRLEPVRKPRITIAPRPSFGGFFESQPEHLSPTFVCTRPFASLVLLLVMWCTLVAPSDDSCEDEDGVKNGPLSTEKDLEIILFGGQSRTSTDQTEPQTEAEPSRSKDWRVREILTQEIPTIAEEQDILGNAHQSWSAFWPFHFTEDEALYKLVSDPGSLSRSLDWISQKISWASHIQFVESLCTRSDRVFQKSCPHHNGPQCRYFSHCLISDAFEKLKRFKDVLQVGATANGSPTRVRQALLMEQNRCDLAACVQTWRQAMVDILELLIDTRPLPIAVPELLHGAWSTGIRLHHEQQGSIEIYASKVHHFSRIVETAIDDIDSSQEGIADVLSALQYMESASHVVVRLGKLHEILVLNLDKMRRITQREQNTFTSTQPLLKCVVKEGSIMIE
jgi:hypothetical protein